MRPRDEIPTQARQLAEHILRECKRLEGKRSPIEVFTRILERELLQAYDEGQKQGKRTAAFSARAKRN